ncbi:hypothetical protein BDW62DRAFT_217873 [Aspergillus aurantiobrunneus]
MHNHIAKSLNLPWEFHSTECPAIEDVVNLAKNPTTAGLVVTMPYKSSVMAHLDQLDDLATMVGACNNIYYPDGEARRLCGTNTDWTGIKGCLLEKGEESLQASSGSKGSALIIGAGGASRAAVYALSQHLHCSRIYILNRDETEVRDLVRDAQRLPSVPEITHITTIEQARGLPVSPYYIVGTVPDLEPQTKSERNVATILEWFLAQPTKGALLDMCFKPRRTRMIKLAERLGWPCVEGTHVIGYQIEEQWRLWAGEEKAGLLDRQGAWRVLLKAAEESTAIN